MNKNNDTEHDFKGVLETIRTVELMRKDEIEKVIKRNIKEIRVALRLAHRLQSGEVSDGMLLAAKGSEHDHSSFEAWKEFDCGQCNSRFKAMTAQMIKEVCDDQE